MLPTFFFLFFLCKVDYHYEADWVSEADVQTVIQSARSSGRIQAAPRASGFQALPSSFGVRNSPYTHLHRHLERIVPHSTKASATSCAPHEARGGSKRGEAYVSFFPSCVGPAEPYPVSFDVCGQLRRTLPRLSSFDTQQVSFPSLSTRIDAPRRATNEHGAAQHARASSRHAHHSSQHVDVQGPSGFHWIHLSLLHPITVSDRKERRPDGNPNPPTATDLRGPHGPWKKDPSFGPWCGSDAPRSSAACEMEGPKCTNVEGKEEDVVVRPAQDLLRDQGGPSDRRGMRPRMRVCTSLRGS